MNILNDAFNAAQASYHSKCTAIGDLDQIDFTRAQGINVGVGVYKNRNTGDIIIAFQGTDFGDVKSIADTSPMIFGVSPFCKHHSNKTLNNYISDVRAQYPGSNIILTGHSKGAALAAVLSHKHNLAAIVFDNPGSIGKKRDFTRVLSIQSTPNIVNDRGPLVQQGKVVELKDDAGIFKKAVRALPAGGVLCGTSSHDLDHIGKLIKGFDKNQRHIHTAIGKFNFDSPDKILQEKLNDAATNIQVDLTNRNPERAQTHVDYLKKQFPGANADFFAALSDPILEYKAQDALLKNDYNAVQQACADIINPDKRTKIEQSIQQKLDIEQQNILIHDQQVLEEISKFVARGRVNDAKQFLRLVRDSELKKITKDKLDVLLKKTHSEIEYSDAIEAPAIIQPTSLTSGSNNGYISEQSVESNDPCSNQVQLNYDKLSASEVEEVSRIFSDPDSQHKAQEAKQLQLTPYASNLMKRPGGKYAAAGSREATTEDLSISDLASNISKTATIASFVGTGLNLTAKGIEYFNFFPVENEEQLIEKEEYLPENFWYSGKALLDGTKNAGEQVSTTANAVATLSAVAAATSKACSEDMPVWWLSTIVGSATAIGGIAAVTTIGVIGVTMIIANTGFAQKNINNRYIWINSIIAEAKGDYDVAIDKLEILKKRSSFIIDPIKIEERILVLRIKQLSKGAKLLPEALKKEIDEFIKVNFKYKLINLNRYYQEYQYRQGTSRIRNLKLSDSIPLIKLEEMSQQLEEYIKEHPFLRSPKIDFLKICLMKAAYKKKSAKKEKYHSELTRIKITYQFLEKALQNDSSEDFPPDEKKELKRFFKSLEKNEILLDAQKYESNFQLMAGLLFMPFSSGFLKKEQNITPQKPSDTTEVVMHYSSKYVSRVNHIVQKPIQPLTNVIKMAINHKPEISRKAGVIGLSLVGLGLAGTLFYKKHVEKQHFTPTFTNSKF